MSYIALKIDVDTWRGTREGVPALVDLLQRYAAPATFLFSLGPDHTGRALRRAFRPGFFSKVSRTSVVEHYGLRTLLYGTVLPGPDIGRREANRLRAVAQAGFETGVHTWDHTRWQDGVAHANVDWTRRELQRATDRYQEIFGHAPSVHGAAGWQMNESAYRLEAEMGYQIVSDSRGDEPYLPVDAKGDVLGPAQFPTTLPTLDELLGVDGWTPANVHEALLKLTPTNVTPQVYTLHAELEGQKLRPTFERLLQGWQAQGHQFLTLGQLTRLPCYAHHGALPRRRAVMGSLPGRSGTLAMPGEQVPAQPHSAASR